MYRTPIKNSINKSKKKKRNISAYHRTLDARVKGKRKRGHEMIRHDKGEKKKTRELTSTFFMQNACRHRPLYSGHVRKAQGSAVPWA